MFHDSETRGGLDYIVGRVRLEGFGRFWCDIEDIVGIDDHGKHDHLSIYNFGFLV